MAEIRSIQNLLIVYYYLYIPKCLKNDICKTANLSDFCISSFELEAKENVCSFIFKNDMNYSNYKIYVDMYLYVDIVVFPPGQEFPNQIIRKHSIYG